MGRVEQEWEFEAGIECVELNAVLCIDGVRRAVMTRTAGARV